MGDLVDDEHIDVCQNIEESLKIQYEIHKDLTDSQCIFALDNAKIAIKKEFGFAKNERVKITENTKGIIDNCIEIGKARIEKINDLTLKEYINRIDKIKRSVKRHSEFGNRGYYEFIKNYV